LQCIDKTVVSALAGLIRGWQPGRVAKVSAHDM
jgi:hypothetical protein